MSNVIFTIKRKIAVDSKLATYDYLINTHEISDGFMTDEATRIGRPDLVADLHYALNHSDTVVKSDEATIITVKDTNYIIATSDDGCRTITYSSDSLETGSDTRSIAIKNLKNVGIDISRLSSYTPKVIIKSTLKKDILKVVGLAVAVAVVVVCVDKFGLINYSEVESA